MNAAFVALLALLFTLFYRFLFPRLTGARWQFVASVPVRLRSDGNWRAINLTWYGVFLALGGSMAVALFLLATGSVHVPVTVAALCVAVILGTCLPAARLIAKWVEGSPHGFTVGGASFVGILLAPPLLLLLDACGIDCGGDSLPALPLLAGMAIAYVLGEGVGRLACLSFGCCRGCHVDRLAPPLRPLFLPIALDWEGDTRHALWGPQALRNVVPVQTITCVLYTVIALLGLYAFLEGYFRLALAGTLGLALGWRVVSEFLRADWRGGKRFSVYQWMAMFAIAWVAAWATILPASAVQPVLADGLAIFLQVPMLLLLQLTFVAMFSYTGTSTMTRSDIRFSARRRRVFSRE